MEQNRKLYPLNPYQKRMHDLLVREAKERMRVQAAVEEQALVPCRANALEKLLGMASERGLHIQIEISPHRMVPAGAGGCGKSASAWA